MNPDTKQPASPPEPVKDGSERLILALDRLMDIVEGCRGQRWSVSGRRLVDTPEWCELYVAWCAINRMPLVEAPGSEPMFALSYDDLQEIHTLIGQVCGWPMSLPTKMISQAKEVHRRMLDLNRIDLTQRKRLREAKAFIARFNTMFAKARNNQPPN